MNNDENKPSANRELKHVHLNATVECDCPACGKSPVVIYERVLIEGSLENYHLVHTEVEDFYECPACKHSWKKFQYL